MNRTLKRSEYQFIPNPSSNKKVIFDTGLNIKLSDVLLIVHTETNTILFNPYCKNLGGEMVDNVLTLYHTDAVNGIGRFDDFQVVINDHDNVISDFKEIFYNLVKSNQLILQELIEIKRKL